MIEQLICTAVSVYIDIYRCVLRDYSEFINNPDLSFLFCLKTDATLLPFPAAVFVQLRFHIILYNSVHGETIMPQDNDQLTYRHGILPSITL